MPAGTPAECEEKIIICQQQQKALTDGMTKEQIKAISNNDDDAECLIKATEKLAKVTKELRLKYP